MTENKDVYADSSKPFKIPFSHEGVARTDRIYLSQDFFSDYSTKSTYIGIKFTHYTYISLHTFKLDNPGENDHCIVTVSPFINEMEDIDKEDDINNGLQGVHNNKIDGDLILDKLETLYTR